MKYITFDHLSVFGRQFELQPQLQSSFETFERRNDMGTAGDDIITTELGVEVIDAMGHINGDTLIVGSDGRSHAVDLSAGTSVSDVTVIELVDASSSMAVFNAALANEIYINVHTNAVGSGEVRGNVQGVISDTMDASGRTVVFDVSDLLGTNEVPNVTT